MKNTKEQLCPKCRTGYESYIIDMRSVVCPFIACNNGVSCGRFVPLIQQDEQDK